MKPSQAELERRWQAQRAAKGLPTNTAGVQFAVGPAVYGRVRPRRSASLSTASRAELADIRRTLDTQQTIADVNRLLEGIR